MTQKTDQMMEVKSKLTIATWNVCLGVANKKDMITDCLKNKNIDVCCLQETEIPMNFPEEVLNVGDYVLELELNDKKTSRNLYQQKNKL